MSDIGSTNGDSATSEIANEQANFRELFCQTPEMVCILAGPQHRFEYVNAAHIRALGFNATGMLVREAQPESVEVHGLLDEVYKSGETAELREIAVTLTDRVRYFNLTYAPRRNDSGEVTGIMILGNEVTEQVVIRKMLHNHTEALEMLLSGAPTEDILNKIVVAAQDSIGRNILASILILDHENGRLLHGAAPSLPDDYSKQIHGMKIGPREGSCGSAAYTGQETIVEDIETSPFWRKFRNLARQFALKSCWSTPIRSTHNRIVGTFAFYNRDPGPRSPEEQHVVTLLTRTAALVLEKEKELQHRKKAEEELRQSQQLLSAKQQQLSLAVLVSKIGFYDWDIPNDQVTFSGQMKKDWGIGENTVNSLKDAVERIHHEDRNRVSSMINETIETDRPYEIEYRVVREDNDIRWVSVRGKVERDSVGNAIRFFGTSLDITDIKRKEVAFENAKLAAEAANAAKSRFLANMSHEIRTPLSAILGFLDLLKNPMNSPTELKNFVDVIERNSQQLLHIVNDILDLSKIEAGKLDFESIEFSLSKLIKDFTSLMQIKAQNKKLLFEVEMLTEIPSKVVGDPTRVQQILSNMIGNSIKFTNSGRIKLSVGYEGNRVTFIVEDTGIGISKEIQKKLFKPFSQADETTSRYYGGTGLGLALIRRLTKAMGGSASLVKSELGKGSTFRAEFQLSEATFNAESVRGADQNLPNNKSMESELGGLKVLVVDDCIDNRDFVEIILKRMGAEVITAQNAREGIDRALNEVVDVLLMDVQMPSIDGYQATAMLRSSGFTKPIVAITAHAMKEERRRCLDSGFSYFLPKPIQSQDLFSLLNKIPIDRDRQCIGP